VVDTAAKAGRTIALPRWPPATNQLDLHQLALKYADIRLLNPVRERRLLASLAQGRQQTPVVAPALEGVDEGESDVLLDGYARVRALRGLGRDVVNALALDLPEGDALLGSLRGRRRNRVVGLLLPR